MRSPLTLLYEELNTLAAKIELLTEDHRNYILDRICPSQEEKPKVTRQKRQAKSEKRGLPESTSKPDQQEAEVENAGEVAKGGGPFCTICAYPEDYQDHYQPSPHYHPFAPPASGKKKSGKVVAIVE